MRKTYTGTCDLCHTSYTTEKPIFDIQNKPYTVCTTESHNSHQWIGNGKKQKCCNQKVDLKLIEK